MTRVEEVQTLIDELAKSKVHFAQLYLHGRRGPKVAGREPTTDDARMGARLAMNQSSIRDPEIIRLEIYALTGIVRAAGEE